MSKNTNNLLFENCKKRFVIDINDNEDVQITSFIEPTKENKDIIVNLKDDKNPPKELKYKLEKGRKGKFQFKTCSSDKSKEVLRELVANILNEENMSTRLLRSKNHLSQFPLTRSRMDIDQILTRSRSKGRSNNINKKNENNVASTSGVKKITKTLQPKTKKRTRSPSDHQEEQQVKKKKKVTKKETAKVGKSVRNNVVNNSRSKATRGRKSQIKNARTARPSTPATFVSSINEVQQPIELIDLIDTTVESENVSEQPTPSNILTDNANEQTLQTELEPNRQLDQQNHLNQSEQSIPINVTVEDQTRYSSLLNRRNQHSVNNRTSLEHLNLKETTIRSSNEENELMRRYFDYQDLERRLGKIREEKTELKNRQITQTAAKQEKRTPSIYHLNDNLISIDYKLGQKHLITSLLIILIGELVHYLQPKSNLNYDQLPIGCILISNIVNSIQFTIIGHLLFKFTNLLIPKLFSLFKTTSRLLGYCLLLFLSYGMLRKTLTNWVLNSNKSIKSFPLNVTICSVMLILYSVLALGYSTDGNRIVKRRKSARDESNDDELCDEKSKDNWLNSIINLLIPFIIISPIIGANTVRLYNVPKLSLVFSAFLYLAGIYKYLSGRSERTNFKEPKLMVYQLGSNSYLFSNATSRVRFLTLFGSLLIITAYNLLILNLWSLILEFSTILYLKLKSNNLDKYFSQLNKSVYNRYKKDKPFIFNSWIH